MGSGNDEIRPVRHSPAGRRRRTDPPSSQQVGTMAGRMTNQIRRPNDEWRRLASPGVTPTEAEGSRLGTRNALSGRGLTTERLFSIFNPSAALPSIPARRESGQAPGRSNRAVSPGGAACTLATGASPWSAAERIPRFLFPFLLEAPVATGDRGSKRMGAGRLFHHGLAPVAREQWRTSGPHGAAGESRAVGTGSRMGWPEIPVPGNLRRNPLPGNPPELPLPNDPSCDHNCHKNQGLRD